jgi:8-oxo-dGTP pyrophosphatase MutT (NUDIX family)
VAPAGPYIPAQETFNLFSGKTDEGPSEQVQERTDPYAPTVRTGVEVAVFVTRRSGSEVLIVHRSREQGGYWHVVAGGVENGETVVDAAERELREETGLVAQVTGGVEVTEYADSFTKEPAERRDPNDPSAVQVDVTCFRVSAPDDWEPTLDWEHDGHRWCNPAEAVSTLRWPGTARALRQLFAVEPS